MISPYNARFKTLAYLYSSVALFIEAIVSLSLFSLAFAYSRDSLKFLDFFLDDSSCLSNRPLASFSSEGFRSRPLSEASLPVGCLAICGILMKKMGVEKSRGVFKDPQNCNPAVNNF